MREYNKRLYLLYSIQSWKEMLSTLDKAIRSKSKTIKFKINFFKYKIFSKILKGKKGLHYKIKYDFLKNLKNK